MAIPKKICFVATNKETCDQVQQQLNTLLSTYIQSAIWCLTEPAPPDVLDNDIFITSNQLVYQQIIHLIPLDKKILVASRTLKIENLEQLLALRQGTEVLLVCNHEKTAVEIIESLHKLAINNIVLHPFWPGKKTYPKHVKVAMTVGHRSIPPEIQQVIDLGVRTLDLSTFVRLIIEMDLPSEIIDEISAFYISTIINVLHRRLQLAEQREYLKNHLEAVLNTVDQGIIAIDGDELICLFNPTAETMLGLNIQDVIGKHITTIIPQIDDDVTTRTNVVDTIQKIGDHYYIINTTPIFNAVSSVSGVVVSLKATNEVQELDSKVRRELKRKGNIAKHTFSDILSISEEMTQSITLAKKFAKSDLTILLEGESGTGKELFAQSIHNASNRCNAPFVAINFAALPENLIESELFGYEDGAFTGARKGGKIGIFEEAHTGTIFLDEIGDASIEVQKRLLRVLEEKEVRRVGGGTVTPVDVRVIAATNQNLRRLMKDGKFRQDLYFRLCTIQIVIPPLRRRKEDIPALIAVFARRLYQRELRLVDHVQEYLITYDWPGNVRELQNIVKFLCSMVESNEMATTIHLPQYLLEHQTEYDEPFVAPTNKDIEAVVSEFRQGSLETIFWILFELRQAEKFNRTMGRYSISTFLAKQAILCPEHKVRVLLKRLEEKGCITTAITKQGSRITKLGEKALAFLQILRISQSEH